MQIFFNNGLCELRTFANGIGQPFPGQITGPRHFGLAKSMHAIRVLS
jgi:hypothetical protein